MKRNPRHHEQVPAHVKRALFRAAEDALTRNGWTVSRAPDARGTSVRRIEKVGSDGKPISHIVGIRTSQNGAVGFTRDKTETFWIGLSDAKFILVSCVDDFENPRLAVLHLYDAARVKTIFSNEYRKKKKAGEKLKPRTGFFLRMDQLPAIHHLKYFGEWGILKRPEDMIALDDYIELGSGNLRSSIKAIKSVDRSVSEWETLLARSLGVDRKAVSIKIPGRRDQSSVKDADPGRATRTTKGNGGSKLLLASLSSKELKHILFKAAVDLLEEMGHQVDKDPQARGTNTRRLTQVVNGESKSTLISIRTSKNGKIGYKRNSSNTFWDGLQDLEFVVISCLDDPRRPSFADIHFLRAEQVGDKLSSALRSRKRAGRDLKPGETLWIPLYERSSPHKTLKNTEYDGGGLAYIGTFEPFPDQPRIPRRRRHIRDLRHYVLLSSNDATAPAPTAEKITIPEAAKGVALSYDVPEREVAITITYGPTKRKRRQKK